MKHIKKQEAPKLKKVKRDKIEGLNREELTVILSGTNTGKSSFAGYYTMKFFPELCDEDIKNEK